jgi:four helix bundle protein
MATVHRFEDLRVWREARVLAARIDECCSRLPLRHNFGLANQMRRAATSIGSNIAEGFERESPRSFRYFLSIAKGSAAELCSQLYLCEDRSYLDPPTAEALRQQAKTISAMLRGLIRHLDRRARSPL